MLKKNYKTFLSKEGTAASFSQLDTAILSVVYHDYHPDKIKLTYPRTPYDENEG